MRFLATLAVVLGGLHGMVTKGPTQPVCRQGEPCSGPAQVTLLFKRRGHTYRTRSAADGTYRISLPTGIYTVSTVEKIGIYPNIRPTNVKVRARHDDRLDFSIDTGIR
jgi:hypothetical protein